ncbi:MAG: Rieske (2Fe-2S) protein [Haloplanus sp.]
MDDRRITTVEEVPHDTTVLFTVRHADTDELREVVLVRTDGSDGDSTGGGVSVAGWLNYCQHLLDVNLDKGSGATMRDGELVCTNHGAYFESGTGLCTHGPCEGAYLTRVDVTVRDGGVYLTDDDYEFVAVGPADDDGPAPTTNVEFYSRI